MNKYKRLRKIRQSIIELRNRDIKVTYYYLIKGFDNGLIKGIKIDDVIYLYFDDLLRYVRS